MIIYSKLKDFFYLLKYVLVVRNHFVTFHELPNIEVEEVHNYKLDQRHLLNASNPIQLSYSLSSIMCR